MSEERYREDRSVKPTRSEKKMETGSNACTTCRPCPHALSLSTKRGSGWQCTPGLCPISPLCRAELAWGGGARAWDGRG
eukprot:3358179-Rhodomonas_salina.2